MSSNELERYEPTAPAPVASGSGGVDSWVQIIAEVGSLASKIADTDFVPDSMRGKTAAVAAAILAGREMGVGPMTALQNIHVIKGKPGQSAQLMRQLVLTQGHSIRYVETTDTRCVVEGRRKGEEEWERVTFTADQAKKARIDLGTYPEDKLVARATARLCRRKFADCLGGMAYTAEELEDNDAPGGAGGETEPPGSAEKPKRTARRRSPVKGSGARSGADTSETTEHRSAANGPEPELDEPPPEPTGNNQPITRDQLTKLQAIFSDNGLNERDTRLRICSQLAERELASANDLTKAEAITLIDALESLASTGDLPAVVAELLDTTTSTADSAAAETENTVLFGAEQE